MTKKKEKRELHPLEAGFNEQMKEFKDFSQGQLSQYQEAGNQIDMASFTNHFKMMFLFGKINELEKQIAELKGAKDGKETGKGTGSKKTANAGDDNPLQLGL